MIIQRGCLSGPLDEFRRRDFIKVGSLGFLGISMSQALRLEAATGGKVDGKGKSCILVFLEGGPSQMDTWDPKPRTSFRAIPTKLAVMQVAELLLTIARRQATLR